MGREMDIHRGRGCDIPLGGVVGDSLPDKDADWHTAAHMYSFHSIPLRCNCELSTNGLEHIRIVFFPICVECL